MTRRAFLLWHLMLPVPVLIGSCVGLFWQDADFERLAVWPTSRSAQTFALALSCGLLLGLIPFWTWMIRSRLAQRRVSLGWTWLPAMMAAVMLAILAYRVIFLAMPDEFGPDAAETAARSSAAEVVAGLKAWRDEHSAAFRTNDIALQVAAALMLAAMAGLTVWALRPDPPVVPEDLQAFD